MNINMIALRNALLQTGVRIVATQIKSSSYSVEAKSAVNRTPVQNNIDTPMPDMPTTAETTHELKQRLGKELYRLELDLQNGGRIAGKPCDCQPGTSLIYVTGDKNSIITLEEAHRRKTKGILTHLGNRKPITAHMVRKHSGILKEIQFRYLSDSFQATAEHPIFVAKDAWRWNWRNKYNGIKEDNLLWVKSADISENDFIAFPRLSKMADMDIITHDLAELIGWYLAEGCKVEDRIVLSLGYHEKYYIERVQELFRKTYGKLPKLHHRKTSLHMAYSNREFTALFDVFGHNALEKRLPEWFLYLPYSKQGRMLKGLFAGDGHLDKYGLTYATSSVQLAYQIHIILFRLGILHSLSHRMMNNSIIEGREIKPTVETYFIRVTGESMIHLQEIADMPWKSVGVRKARNMGWVGEGNIFLPVSTIKNIPYEGKVYNISVEDDESYLTPHGAVHNCLSKKHRFGIEATAEELMSYEKNPVYGQAISWIGKHAPTFEPVEIAKHPPEYYQALIPEVRVLRKQVMGTEDLSSLTSGE